MAASLSLSDVKALASEVPIHPMLHDEVEDVASLLAEYAADDSDETRQLVARIAASSMGPNHLWEDLGLPSRAALGELMQRHFPALKARNHRQMRWKKFIYRELCERASVPVCRSPHCDACDEQHICFAPED